MNAIILLAIFGVIMMLSSAFIKRRRTYKYIAIGGIIITLIANFYETYNGALVNIDLHDLLLFTQTGYLFNTIILLSTAIYFMLSSDEIGRVGSNAGEYFALIFFVLCGISVLTCYNNLLMLFLGIEIMSIPLYILTGSEKRNLKGNEAALKYFLMGSFTTGVMLMGIALIYGGTGTFQLTGGYTDIPPMTSGVKYMSFFDVTGMILLLAALGFKVSAAPFHFWTPDVYDGAPSVFTSFMATIVKVGAFVAFYILFAARANELSVQWNASVGINWHMLFAVVIVLTLLIGNITAVFQYSVKRMLAYSSIAQAGFMMFALFSLNKMATEGLVLYSVAYSFATIGIFAVLMKLKDYSYDGFNGLAKKEPVLAATAIVFLLSLTGIPLTAGFFAKYYMLASALQVPGYMWLVIVAVIFAAVSAYYYFRVIQAMYFKDGEPELNSEIKTTFKAGLIILAAIILLLGIFPQYVLNYLYF
ncbi:NADH-quinone oxidoreductase subunit N [Haoranjiania flava]|uniref:NADH-quinone oxidoreductase subunit N n=1 Tax=Haoranjiania flava TaxID=1856322 RepID=A0AAE3IMQ5_9BACT|nr:NADH-quinone oxidoreductase subunit N [Haoranjiania flava]MCU7693923.1 NADH-quinone oxidoreductase subunit N [Haoranjiania flava]